MNFLVKEIGKKIASSAIKTGIQIYNEEHPPNNAPPDFTTRHKICDKFCDGLDNTVDFLEKITNKK